MLRTVSLAELANGQVIELSVGDTLRVVVSFKYTVAEDTIVTLRACPYHYVLGVLDPIEGSCGEADIDLERSATLKLKEAIVDMPIVPAAEGGIANGTYGLIAEILGTDAEDHIDDCLVISGNPPSPIDMVGPLLVLGLMAAMVSQMVPILKEGFS